jgi:hypothetical protein
MKVIPLFLLLALGGLAPRVHAQSEFMNRMENGGVSVEVPQSWASQASREPVVLMLVDTQPGNSLVAVREAKRKTGTRSLQQYFDLNVGKVVNNWPDARMSDTREMTGGTSVLWKDGSVTLSDPKRGKVPANVLLAAAETKDFYYLILITDQHSGSTDLAQRILESLRFK